MYEWILAAVVVFFASILQAATGFGFAIMATPFLLLVFDSRESVQISIILSFVLSLLLIRKVKKDVDKGLLRRLILGSVVGVPLGVLFYKSVSFENLKVTMSIVILIVTFIQIIKSFKTNSKLRIEHSNVKTLLCKDTTAVDGANYLKKTQFFIGFCAGLLTTSIGIPGIPLILYYTATKTKKETARSTAIAFFLFVCIISMAAQLLTVRTNLDIVASSLILVPIAAVGIFLGNILFDKINQITFQRIIYGVLLCTGFYMSIKTF